jgi:ketol-acid reductoisomerase
MKVYGDSDAGLSVLKGKTVSIVGYDGQARAQAPQTCS